MRHITCPSRASDSLLCKVAWTALLAVLICAASTKGSRRPQYGGILRVQISERIDSIDPLQWPSVSADVPAPERVDSLVFDRLVRIDEQGALQPSLAISWQHDALWKRWEFRLRDGVKFSDGTPLTAPVAAMALQQLLGAPFNVSANSVSVVIQSNQSLPNFPTRLATGRYFVFHAGEDGSLAGTGPFRFTLMESVGGVSMMVLGANETCWAGRPFVDKIVLSVGVDIEQQANAIAYGQADVVELPASQVRRATQRGVRTSSSDSIDLFALVWDASRASVHDLRLRQATSLAIDRSSIADVILQKQGVTAGGLLPNWISGYAHLFPVAFEVSRAKDLLAASGHELSHPTPLVLVYDSHDAEARAIADRVAVNLREVGIVIQVLGQSADGKMKAPAADLRLVRHHIVAPDPAEALSEMLPWLGESAANPETLEQVYEAERAPIEAFRVIPIVHVTESYGLSPQVRDWMAPRWGGWNLADVWLGPPAATGGNTP
jgi:peptide/nickel transport system substrate-binding protein